MSLKARMIAQLAERSWKLGSESHRTRTLATWSDEMKVYIASSWKNALLVRALAMELRKLGHEVYDFTDPENFIDGVDGFAFDAIDVVGKPRNEIDWLEFSQTPEAQLSCDTDKAGLDWSEILILLLPCGRSAHLEAGIAFGQGKPVIIYGDLPPGEFECIYNLTPHRYSSTERHKVVEAMSHSLMEGEEHG